MAQPRRKKNGISAITNQTIGKLASILLVLLALLVLIIFRLIYLQVFTSEEGYAAQIDQSMAEVETSSSRGNILDRNGNILVKDSSAKAVYIVPMNVKKEDEKRIAEILSAKLNKEYEKMLATTSRLEDDAVEVKSSVSDDEYKNFSARGLKGFEIKNGKLLCYPAQIEKVPESIRALVEVFGMEAADAEKYVTRKENQPIKIKTRVSNDLAQSLQKEIYIYDEKGNVESTNGLDLLDDHVRYYTNGTYLAHVLGFTDDEYQGAYGIERTCNDVLSGNKGVVLYQLDAEGNTIPSQTKVIQEPTQGEDVTLTIDINVQNTAEKLIAEAVNKYNASSGTAIVMATKTAEVLAMATYPSYDLNNPETIQSEYASHRASKLSSLEGDQKLLFMWKNPAVGFIYEPGSTFKAVTSAAALEEGAVSPDTVVYCEGGYSVDGINVNCTGYHGAQTVAEAIANSCNPGLIQIIQELHPNLFYKYAYNFGYGQKTGIELDGEEAGILSRVIENDGTWQNINYVTMSFGQGLASTPIQNLTALNAVVNNGYYVKPTILSENNVTSVSRNGGQPAIKQIVSQQTSETLRNIMANVVQNNSGAPWLAEQSEGCSIGGKTGTAEQFIDGEYSAFYVTSFFGFAPVEDPEYSVLILLDGTDSTLTGSVTAAPVGVGILKELLNGNMTASEAEVTGNIAMPDVVGQSIDNAKKILSDKGIAYRILQQDEGTTVLSQSVGVNEIYTAGTEVELVIGSPETDEKVTVPDLTGLSIQACNQMLRGLSLKLKVSGSGFAVKQDPAAGTQVERNSVVTVTFRN